MPELNVPLLRKTLDHIKAHPNELRQEFWRCDTGMCFAGWAVTLAGGRWLVQDLRGEDGEPSTWAEVLRPEPDDDPELLWPTPYGAGMPCAGRAQRLLGLTLNQADALFHADNTITDLEYICERLVAGEADR